MPNTATVSSRQSSQGYVLVSLTLAIALIMIALTAGLASISTELRREREEELVHRGVQYTRAIRSYYRRFGAYPVSLEQLEDTNHMRFLRRRYADPMTGDDFRLLHVGEVQLAYRTGPLALKVDPTAAVPGGYCSADVVGDGQAPSDSSSPQLGGGPIIGVASTSKKVSFHVYNCKNHYNEWQFVYSPVLDRGGLFTQPYDGIPNFANPVLPPTALPGQGLGQQGPAPGVPLPPTTGANKR